MRDAEAVRKLVDNAVTMLDGLDILITNAGGPPAGNFEDFNLQDWQDATQLTLLSHISAIQAALPTLKNHNVARFWQLFRLRQKNLWNS
jgi:3-oxoacyl-[acyl-carrier protein] reductase